MSTFIIATCDSFKAFLTGSIPNLKFDCFPINFNSSNFEIYSYCWHEVIMEYIILKYSKYTGHKINLLTANLSKSEDFPTPEFPISNTLKR